MKTVATALIVLWSFSAFAQSPKPVTLRSNLLEQLHTTHDQKDWFVPIDVAVDGLTAEQATWTDGKGNHSVGQLATHLVFWDRRSLEQFEGKPVEKYNGNNDETFTRFDSKQWDDTVKQLDEVMTEWEKAVEAADDAKLQSSYSTIAHIGTHNAYHIGQIIYVRKEQGSWNPANGVH